MKRNGILLAAMAAAAVSVGSAGDANAQVFGAAPIGFNTALTGAFTPFLGTLSFAPNFATNQVVISSTSSAFTNLFGASSIFAPIGANGLFATSVPFTLAGFGGIPLFANFAGALPFANGVIGTGGFTSLGFGFGTPWGALGPWSCGAALPFACSGVVF